MKKREIIIPLMILISISFVSAVDVASGLNKGSNQLIDSIKALLTPFASALFGGSGMLLLERVLFAAIVVSLVYIAVSRMPMFKDNKAVIWIITISVTLLSTRYLTETQLVQNILLPYSVFGVTITAVLPFIIYFFFVQSFQESSVVRKTLWIFFIIVFIGLWADRYDELGKLSWIYMMTAIAAFIFLAFDGTIRRILVKQQMQQLNMLKREDLEADTRRRLKAAEDDLKAKIITQAQFNRIKNKLQTDLKTILKG